MPRGPQRAADQEAEPPPTDQEAESPATDQEPAPPPQQENTTLLPVLADDSQTALVPARVGPPVKIDPGLYAVLGLDPSASDAEIQTTYRRMAARLIGGGSDNQALKQLNVAYEVLGNPVRRVEYDRMRTARALMPAAAAPTPIRPGAKVARGTTRRRRPRMAVQQRYAGLGDVMVVLSVVGLAVVAGYLLIPRLAINLSALNALQSVLPLSNTSRRVIDVTVTAVPTPQATPTPLPSVSQRYAGSTVDVSNPNPAQNTNESVQIHLKRDGQAVPNADIWSSVDYRTTSERWPASGTVKTDSNGAATITFNIGPATPNYPVTVHVYTQADDQQLSWSTSFTPH